MAGAMPALLRFYDFLVNFITMLLHFNAKFSIINTDKL